MKCWICGGEGTTREHLLKASDIRDYFGRPSAQEPLFFHDDRSRNRDLVSINSKRLSSRALLCAQCNNARTQAHDNAWMRLSRHLQAQWSRISRRGAVNLRNVFPAAERKQMLNVHLYFLKQFGGRIAQDNLPIPLEDFADAIMRRHAHPTVYLRITETAGPKIRSMGVTHVNIRYENGALDVAGWTYMVGPVSIEVVYSVRAINRQDFWHPDRVRNVMKIARPISRPAGAVET